MPNIVRYCSEWAIPKAHPSEFSAIEGSDLKIVTQIMELPNTLKLIYIGSTQKFEQIYAIMIPIYWEYLLSIYSKL